MLNETTKSKVINLYQKGIPLNEISKELDVDIHTALGAISSLNHARRIHLNFEKLSLKERYIVKDYYHDMPIGMLINKYHVSLSQIHHAVRTSNQNKPIHEVDAYRKRKIYYQRLDKAQRLRKQKKDKIKRYKALKSKKIQNAKKHKKQQERERIRKNKIRKHKRAVERRKAKRHQRHLRKVRNYRQGVEHRKQLRKQKKIKAKQRKEKIEHKFNKVMRYHYKSGRSIKQSCQHCHVYWRLIIGKLGSKERKQK